MIELSKELLDIIEKIKEVLIKTGKLYEINGFKIETNHLGGEIIHLKLEDTRRKLK